MYSHLKRGQFLFQVFISLAVDLPETRTVPVSGAPQTAQEIIM